MITAPPSIVIWRALSADAGVLAALEKEAFGSRSWGAVGVKDSLAAPGVETLLAGLKPGDPSAFAIWRDLGEDAEILTIGVSPRARRLGLGRALLARAIEHARLSGCATMFLEVDFRNSDALALYVDGGFERIGKRKKYYKDGADALVMRLYL